MKILFLTPYIPYPPSFGGSVRIYHLARSLSRRHEVSILSYSEDGGLGDPSGLETFCRKVILVPRKVGEKRMRQLASLTSCRSFQLASHYSAKMQEAIEKAVRDLDVDVIVVEFSQMAGFHFPSGIPLIIDQHNVEFDLLRRMAKRNKLSFRKIFNLIEAAKFKREELKCLGRADLIMVTSERDERLLKSLIPGLPTVVVTNGVDTDYFKRPQTERARHTAVFVGATHYFPNEDGVLFFIKDIFPEIRRKIPDFHFTIVGGNPPPSILEYASDNITVTGFVDDVRPYIWEGSVFVVPLRMGGGTRFKVVEALASGTPVVSTSLGAEGIPVTDDREVFLADSPEDFAEAVIRALNEPSKADEMINTGLSFVREHFDWKVVGKTMENALTSLLTR